MADQTIATAAGYLIGITALTDEIARVTEHPRPVVAAVLDALAAVTTAGLAHGRRVRLPGGLGILSVHPSAARSGTGPDGRPWTRPAGRRVRLTPGGPLRRAVAPVGDA